MKKRQKEIDNIIKDVREYFKDLTHIEINHIDLGDDNLNLKLDDLINMISYHNVFDFKNEYEYVSAFKIICIIRKNYLKNLNINIDDEIKKAIIMNKNIKELKKL